MLSTQPLFILSNPRSGSSLLRVICDSHKEISVPPECGFTEWWYIKYKDWNLADNFNYRFEIFCFDLISSRKFETWNFDFQLFKSLVNIFSPENYSDLAALVHITFGFQKNKKVKVWGDKNNYYIHKTNLIHKLYPKAKYLYIVRDGRDVATSYIELKKLKTGSPYAPNLPWKIEEIAREWNNNNSKIFSFLSYREKEQVFILKYEDLITNFEQSCLSICRFLNLTFDPNMLNYFNLRLEPKETLDWKKKIHKQPDNLAIGKFKKNLTKDEVSLFNSIAEENLNRFKYEL